MSNAVKQAAELFSWRIVGQLVRPSRRQYGVETGVAKSGNRREVGIPELLCEIREQGLAPKRSRQVIELGVVASAQSDRGFSEPFWKLTPQSLFEHSEVVASVAAEQFVRSIAAQRNGHMLPSHAG